VARRQRVHDQTSRGEGPRPEAKKRRLGLCVRLRSAHPRCRRARGSRERVRNRVPAPGIPHRLPSPSALCAPDRPFVRTSKAEKTDMRGYHDTELSESTRPCVALRSSLAFHCNNHIEANRPPARAQGRNWKVEKNQVSRSP
jgi:hypothetical protein